MKRINVSTPKYPNTFTLVDDKNYEWLNQWEWYVIKPLNVFYAIRKPRKNVTKQRMHRMIMSAKKGQMIDHRDRNGLNNTKSNLRFCTNSQNACNRNSDKNSFSRLKGVSWDKYHKKWVALICKDGKDFFLGYSNSEVKCAKLYDQKAKEFFGRFAYLNFPEKDNVKNLSSTINN